MSKRHHGPTHGIETKGQSYTHTLGLLYDRWGTSTYDIDRVYVGTARHGLYAMRDKGIVPMVDTDAVALYGATEADRNVIEWCELGDDLRALSDRGLIDF